MADEEPSPLSLSDLKDIYKIVVDEYRFQVNLNAARSRDYFVLNSAVIAAGVTLLGKNDQLAGAVFVAGFVVAVLTGLGTHTQHNYYREARDAKQRLERRLGLSDVVVKTTPAAGSRRIRLGSVTRFNYIMVVMLCVVNVTGAFICFSGRGPRNAKQAPGDRSDKSPIGKTVAPVEEPRPTPTPGHSPRSEPRPAGSRAPGSTQRH